VAAESACFLQVLDIVVLAVQAKPYRRVDYSHSSVQLMKIAHDNQLLVNHLTTISKAVRSR
jgi:hypothetical protein